MLSEIFIIVTIIIMVAMSYRLANYQTKKIELLEEQAVLQDEQIDLLKRIKTKLEKDVESMQEIICFDNEKMTKKTEMIDFFEKRIFKLDDENCKLKIDIYELEKERSMMKKRGFRKILKAKRLGRINGPNRI